MYLDYPHPIVQTLLFKHYRSNITDARNRFWVQAETQNSNFRLQFRFAQTFCIVNGQRE